MESISEYSENGMMDTTDRLFWLLRCKRIISQTGTGMDSIVMLDVLINRMLKQSNDIEDTERRERICTLGLKVGRTAGCLYHLHHPRGMNSNFADRERALANRREYIKICRMNRHEMERYISTWERFTEKNDKEKFSKRK